MDDVIAAYICFSAQWAAIFSGALAASVRPKKLLTSYELSWFFNDLNKTAIEVAGVEWFNKKFCYAGIAGFEYAFFVSESGHKDDWNILVWTACFGADKACK